MRKILFFLFAVAFYQNSYSQSANASFVVPDTFCIANPLTLQNTSTGTGLQARWNFCPIDVLAATPGTTFNNLQGYIFHDMDFIKLQNQYLLLTFDTVNLAYINYDYGNNLLNPSPVMGIKSGPKVNCFDFVSEGDTLAGLGIYSPTNSMYLISFPNGINAIPQSTLLASIPSFNHPSSLKLIFANQNYYALITNEYSNTLTCLSFGNSLVNTPVELYSYTVSLANGLIDFDVDMKSNGITGFCTSSGNGNIIKLSFGGGITSPPTAETDLGNFGSSAGKLSLQLLEEKNTSYLFYVEDFYTGYLKSLGFPNNNYSATPTDKNVINYFYKPGIVAGLADSSNFRLVVSDDTSAALWDIPYPFSCSGSTTYSEDFSPVISLTTLGWNKITLSVTDSNGLNSTFTDSVYIVPGPTASFSFTGNTCFNVNDSISFTDLSSSPSGVINSWTWDFDDGTFSSVQNPKHHFSSAGTYDVKLTIQSGCPKDTVVTITINETPVVSFTNTTGCAGSDISFTDQTSAGAATIQSWQWNFGDLSSGSALQNPTHIYSLGGSYLVQLTVQTTQGCGDSASFPVTIKSTPDAAFSISNTCLGDIVEFLNQTTINDATLITYEWDFGNSGATSTLESPTYSYPSAASYTVTLIATSTQSCTDTLVQTVVISNPPVANFSFPANNCQNNSVQFNDNSAGSGISSWVWDFGDGDSSFIQNPTHIYTGSGPFNVNLLVSAGNNCTASISKIINITPGPIAQFTALPVCDGTATNFTDLTTVPSGSTITSWYYTFGDSNAVSVQNPQYTYSGPGTYFATLEVISSDGCVDSVMQAVVVNEIPFANFLVQNQRCAGAGIFFIDLSTVSNSLITNWHWTFSDGDSSSFQGPSHIFQNPGLAFASLTITTDAGCSDDAVQTFDVLAPPAFTISYNSTCFGDTTRFVYTPLNSGTANFAWSWSFGDNQNGYTPNTKHKYASYGTYPISLVVMDSSGCSSTVFDTLTIFGKPDASFLTNGICQDAPMQFVNNTNPLGANILGWNWNFGDNQTSTDSVPEHTYTSSGNYLQTLIVVAEGSCNDTITNLVNIKPKPSAAFTVSPLTGAPNNPINFTNGSSGATQYLWQFGTGLPTTIGQNATYTYPDTGSYTVTLKATSLYGCVDTAIRFIDVIDPYMDLVLKQLSYLIKDNYLHLNALIANAGNTNATAYDLEVNIDGGTGIIETGNDTIPYSSERLYAVNTRFKVSDDNLPAYACVKILNVNKGSDGVLTNNEKCIPLTSSIQIASINPNPVNDFLNIAYTLPEDATVTIDMYDSEGRIVKELFSASENAGLLQHNFAMQGVNGGVYYIRFTLGDEVQFVKFIKL